MFQMLSTIVFLQYFISSSAYIISLNRELSNQVFSPYCEKLCEDVVVSNQIITLFDCDCRLVLTNSKINENINDHILKIFKFNFCRYSAEKILISKTNSNSKNYELSAFLLSRQ